MATLSDIYNWFMTGKKPTQAQFWASWGSFWNKDEAIPQSAISNLLTVLNAKAEKSQLQGHTTDPLAHAELLSGFEIKSEKGEANGYVPLNEFVKISSQFLNIVNDRITGGADALFSAEQGKILQTQINGINALLSSDDLNLDTVQEIIDAIKAVETSLETILVNDLTTGGTTKALTSEMGKVLNQNKADKGGYAGTLQSLKDELIAESNARVSSYNDLSDRIDLLDAEFDYYQLVNNQIYVDASGLVQNSWHGKLVTFTASVTVTVPASGLQTGFNFEGIVDPGVTVNTAMTSPKAWQGAYSGAPIPENSIFTFIQRSNDANKVSIYGL